VVELSAGAVNALTSAIAVSTGRVYPSRHTSAYIGSSDNDSSYFSF